MKIIKISELQEGDTFTFSITVKNRVAYKLTESLYENGIYKYPDKIYCQDLSKPQPSFKNVNIKSHQYVYLLKRDK